MAIEMRLGILPTEARAQLASVGLDVSEASDEAGVHPLPRAEWAALCAARDHHVGRFGAPRFDEFLPLILAPQPGTIIIPGDQPLVFKPNSPAWASGPHPQLRVVGADRVAAAGEVAAREWSEASPRARRAIERIVTAAQAVARDGAPSFAVEAADLLAGAEGDRVDALLAELAAYLDVSTGNGMMKPIPGLEAIDWRALGRADRQRLHDGLRALKGSDGAKRKQIERALLDPIAATLDRPDPVDMSRLDRALPAYATLPWFAALRAGELREAVVKFIERQVPSGAKDPLAFAALRVVTQWPGAAPWFVTFDWKETPRPPAGATRLATPGDDHLYTTLTGGPLDALLAEGLITQAA
ncbi:MAG: hypothetical protein R3F65_14935 [bacterium]|nr:hypothetical protein [Myxococcales bacterium]MCB9552757.1 hypothetical protein [Myxococcales bacterium]